MKLENIDEVLDLFEQIGGKGNENCVFFAMQDKAQVSERGTIIKSVARNVANEFTMGVSGLVSNIIKNSNEPQQNIYDELNLEALNNYRHFLINETDTSIAIIPMLFNGSIILRWKTEEAQVFHGCGRVIPKNLIKKIEITKFSFLTPTIRGVRFDLIDGSKLGFMIATNVKTLPYHIENFKKFNQKHKK